MNPDWFGDSFDIVKRFFVSVLRCAGYSVYVDPMFTGNWESLEKHFLAFIGASTLSHNSHRKYKSALLLDPDIGIGKKPSAQHITIETIAQNLAHHDVVFSFDQSFSRTRTPLEQMKEKLEALAIYGVHGFYYDSHARFLFAAKSRDAIDDVRKVLLAAGLPRKRLVNGGVKPQRKLSD